MKGYLTQYNIVTKLITIKKMLQELTLVILKGSHKSLAKD